MRSILFSLLLVTACPPLAQEQLRLSADDLTLLELEFARVVAAENQLGVPLPGEVVAPPNASNLGIALYAGVLERWHHEAGARVAAGDILATIRSSDVLALQQDYLASHNELQLALNKLDRERQMFDAGIISQRRLQATQTTTQGSELQVKVLAQRLTQGGLGAEELKALVADSLQLGTYSVRAPVDGSLGHRVFKTGEYVPANTAVAELNAASRPWMSIQVPARLNEFLQIGSRFSIAGSGHALTLRQKDFNIDTRSQSVEVLAEFDDHVDLVPGQLRTVLLHPQRGSMLIPAAGVVHEGTETIVYVRNDDGVEVRRLDLLPLGEAYLASRGIRAGEEILVRGTALVKGIQLGLGRDE